jgi:hypothetical protein
MSPEAKQRALLAIQRSLAENPRQLDPKPRAPRTPRHLPESVQLRSYGLGFVYLGICEGKPYVGRTHSARYSAVPPSQSDQMAVESVQIGAESAANPLDSEPFSV